MKLIDYWKRSDGDDWAPAMERCVTASQVQRDEVIELPVGYLKFSRPIVFGTGTLLRGAGGCPSNIGQGTVLAADFDDKPFLKWDGSVNSRGTGGGLDSLVIAAAVGKKPGAAILLTGLGPSNRCGEWDCHRVTVYAGSDAGSFEAGLIVSGWKITTSGSAGIRGVTVRASKFAGCRSVAVVLENAVHFYGQFQTAAATNGKGDVVIGIGSEDVHIDGGIYGTIVLGVCKDVMIAARYSDIRRDQAAKNVCILRRD